MSVIGRTCRNCAKDLNEVEFMSQKETYKRMGRPVPVRVKTNKNGIGWEKENKSKKSTNTIYN